MKYHLCILFSLIFITQAKSELITNGLVIDLNANKGLELTKNKVLKWSNQVKESEVKDFVVQNKGRKKLNSGAPTLKKSIDSINGHNRLVFNRQELINHQENALDHLITGSGYTWLTVLCVHEQVIQLKDVNSFFGNLKNGGKYEGIWGNVSDNNTVWIGSRNSRTMGRWDKNNPMVLAPNPLKKDQFYVIAGRMGSGQGIVQIELFINQATKIISKDFPVNPKANSSKLAIGQERDAIEHPGKESFDGEIARFLLYDRPLQNDELKKAISHLKSTYGIK